MSPHPPSYRLDAVAAGESPGADESHLQKCGACAKYVADLRQEIEAARPSEVESADFVKKVGERQTAPDNVRQGPWGRITKIATVFAAAAALLIFFRAPPDARMTPKGSQGLVVILDHGGSQERLSHDLEVRPGDRFMLDLAVAERGRYEAGLLAESGDWTSLFGPRDCEPGNYVTDQAVRVDQGGLRGLVLFGRETEVKRAREARSLDGVASLRIGTVR